MLTRFRAPILFLLTLLLVPVLAAAQSDEEANGAVQFNFSTPGARSLGMGGSFLASVDDATAAYSNPAGLLQLSKPELLVEGRRWRYETPFADRGRASGTPTGNGVDTIRGVELGTAESELDGLSYAAFVLPRPKWALAFYYHQVADFESSFSTSGIFSRAGIDDYRLFPVRSTYDLEISQAGMAYAHQWSNGAAFGIGVSAYSLRLDSFTQRYSFSGFYSPADFTRDPRVNFQTQTGDEQGVGATVGFLWDRGGKLSTGLVYRFAPKFDIDVMTSSFSPDVPPSQRSETHFAGVFNVPDVFGFGFTLRPSGALTLNLDVNRVLYSEMIEEFVVIFPESQGQRIEAEDFVLEDATEVHAGVEYLITGTRTALALRAGAWYDPDHRLRAEEGSELNKARLFAGEDQFHATAGIGFALGVVQIDVAADVSEETKTATVSTAVRF